MEGTLHVITLDPTFEQGLLAASRAGQEGQVLAIDATVLTRMSTDIGRLVDQAEEAGISPVLICASQLRAPLYRQLRHEFPRLPILSYSELGGPIDIQTVGVVGNEPANVA
jgi:flagellar biosynthesis protein FlhA